MILHNQDATAEVSDITARSFAFTNNAKMFDLVINKMYTNKPGAVIRELSANAWDSHRDAGKGDTPFEIQLPTWLDKTFSIRDYGTGIPHDRFEDIYTNVGASTKEGTNDFIGSFGLGSKVPFTMTDTFMVENWHKGIKSTWVCFKDKGVPQVSKLMEEPSDEPSGLKVTFSFDEGDVNAFTKQVSVQLKYFPVKPVITGGEGKIHFPPLPDEWDTKDYFFTVEEKQRGFYNGNSSYCVMGNVCYRLDITAFPYEYRSIFSTGVVVKVPIGSVDIPPSRENLEMTPRTVKTITDIFDRIKLNYVEDIKLKLSKCKTIIDARKVAIDINTDLVTSSFMDLEIFDTSVRSLRNFSVSNIAGYSIMGIQRIRGGREGYRMAYLNIRKLIENNVKIYVNDLWTNHREHIESNSDKMFHVDPSTNAKIEIRVVQPPTCVPKERAATLAKLIKEVEEELGEPVLLLSSLIGMPPVKAKGQVTSERAEPNQVYKVVKNYSGNGSILNCTEEVTGDLPTDGFYILMNGHSLVTEVKNINQMLYHGLHESLGKPLYFVRKKTLSKLKGLDELTQVTLDGIKDTIVEEGVRISKLYGVRSNLHIISDEYLPVLQAIKDKEIKAYVRLCSFIHRKITAVTKDVRPLASLLDHAMFTTKTATHYQASSRLSKVSNRYGDINEVLNTLTSTYSGERRKARMAALKTLTNN